MPELREFDPAFQGRLPLPLARLYARAHHAKGERERHDYALNLLEASLKLAAAALVSAYRAHGQRSPRVDAALRHLALPSLGQWRDILREALLFLGEDPAARPWVRSLHESLARPGGGEADLADVFLALASAADYRGKAKTHPSLLDLIEILPLYRNAMSGAHGSIKADRAAYGDAAPALLALAGELWQDGRLLGGAKLLFAEDVKLGAAGERRAVWMDLTGPVAMRRQPFEGMRTEEEILPERIYLEVSPAEHLSLHPLLHYQPGDVLDQVFYLNRARSGKSGVQFLSYETGEFYQPGRDPLGDYLVRELEALLSWVTAAAVDSREREALADRSLSDAEEKGDAAVLEEEGEAAGARFGDFEILGELGRGGMAVVYLARQRSLGRLVALKVLPPGLREDRVALGRFKQEVRALSRCDHPNVVKILSSGEVDGTCFYAMELIDGGDLGAVGESLKRRRSSHDGPMSEADFERAASSAAAPAASPALESLPRARPARERAAADIVSGRDFTFRVAAVIRDAARGVQHIHDHGIIHRDLKPQNILITRDDHRPVIMDLGLAKVAETSQSLTIEKGSILGTLRYMPPEQLQRNLLEVDARADVYALGAVLYELACLRPMLDGDTQERLTTQILFEEPLRPEKSNPRLPTDLATVITKATRKDPKERYATAAELADDLDAFVHGEAIAARPQTLGYLLKLFVRRNRIAVGAAAVALVLFAALLAGWIVSIRSAWKEERTAHGIAEGALEKEAEARAEAQASLAAATDSLARMLAEKAERALAEKRHGESALYAAESLRLRESPDARWTLYRARTEARGKFLWATPSGNSIGALAFSPRGDLLATVEGWLSRRIHLWDLATGQEVERIGSLEATAIAFAPDGSQLALGLSSGDIEVWDLARRARAADLKGHARTLMWLAFRAGGKELLSGSRDGAVFSWDLASGRGRAVLEGRGEEIRAFAFSPDGLRAAAGAKDKAVRIVDLATGQEAAALPGEDGRVFALAWSPDGATLAVGLDGGEVRLRSAAKGDLLRAFDGHDGSITSLDFSPDGARLLSASHDTTARVWDVSSGKEVSRLAGHTSDVRQAAFSPDANRIASAGADGTLRLWNAHDGKQAAILSGHSTWVSCVVAAPDGRRIFSSSGDRTIRAWDALTGEEKAVFKGHRGTVRDLALSPDGKVLASASEDTTVRLWHPDRGEEIRKLAGHEVQAMDVDFTADGRKLLSGSFDRTVRVWDPSDGREVRRIEVGAGVYCLDVHPGGDLVACGGLGVKAVRLFRLDTGEDAGTLQGHTAGIMALAFTPDGRRLVSGAQDNTARVWDLEARRETLKLEGHGSWVETVAVSPAGSLIATGEKVGSDVRVWDALTGRPAAVLTSVSGNGRFEVAFTQDGRGLLAGTGEGPVEAWALVPERGRSILEGHSRWISRVKFHPDGRRLLSASGDGAVRVWDTVAGGGAVLEGHSGEVFVLAVPADGKHAASGGIDGIRIWDLDATREVRRIAAAGRVWALAWSPDGALLASGADEGYSVRLWSRDKVGEDRVLDGHQSGVFCLAFAPDGRSLASGSADHTVRLWDVDAGKETRTLFGHEGQVWSVAFRPGGRTLASASDDRKAILWDVETGEEIRRFPHPTPVWCLAWSPDGRRLATGSGEATMGGDYSVRIWDPGSAEEIARIQGHTGPVFTVAFSPDGKRLASGAGEPTVRLWDLDLLLERAEAAAGGIAEETGLRIQGAELQPAPSKKLRWRDSSSGVR